MAEEPEKPVEAKGDNTPPEQTVAQTPTTERNEINLASNTLADVRSSLDILPDDMFKGARPEQRTQQGERLPQADSPEAIIRQLPYIAQNREKLDTLVKGMFQAFSPEGNSPGNMDQAKNSMSEILRLLPPEKRAMFGKWAKCLDEASRQEQNPETARQLKELAENLKVLEKAPGFMRGNLALAMYQWAGQGSNPEEIRSRLTEAQKAMQDTVQNYPGLADDPNFKNRAQAIEQQYGAKLKTAAPSTDGSEVHGGIMERVQKITQDIREGRLPLLYNPDAPQVTNPEITNPSVVDKPTDPKTVDNTGAQAIDKGDQAYIKYRQALEAELAKGTPLEVAAKAALTPEVMKAFEDSIAQADASAKPNGMANARFLQMLTAQRTLEQRTPVEIDGQRISWAQADQGLKQSFNQYVGSLQVDDTQKGQVFKFLNALDSAKSSEEYSKHLQNFQQFLNSNQTLKPLLQDSNLQKLLTMQQSLKTPMYPYLQQLAIAERMVQADDSRAYNRTLYASALTDAGQGDQAKKHLTDAYARVINTNMRTEIALQATKLGVRPEALIDAAITRHENQPAKDSDREPVPPISELLVDMQSQFDATVQNLAKSNNGDMQKAAQEAIKTFGPLYERMANVASANRARIEQMEQPLMADIKNQFAQILQGTGPQGQEILNLQQKVFGAVKEPADINLLAAMLSGDDATKAGAKAELQRTYGDAWVRDFEQWRTMSGDKANLLFAQETRKTLYNVARNDSQMEQFGSRKLYAQNLLAAGDVAGAKAQFTKGLSEASAQVQGQAALSRDVQAFARQLGVDMSPYAAKIPSAPNADQVIPGQDREIQRLQGIPGKAALDPRFSQVSDNDLQKKLASLVSKSPGVIDADLVKQNIADIKPVYEEFIRRAESVPHPDNPSVLVTPTVDQIFEGIKNKFDIIKSGVDPASQRPLTEMQRVQLYRDVLGSMEGVQNSIAMRQQYATILSVAGQMQDAERILKDSKEMSDKINRTLTNEILTSAQKDINDPTIISNAPLPDTGQNRGDVLRASLTRLQGDQPANAFVNMHIMTRVALGRFYMGPANTGNDPVGGAMIQYGNKAGIRPDLAFANLKEAKDLVFQDRNVDILDKNKFLDDVNLSSALALAQQILPSEISSKLGMNESNASLMVNVLSAAAGIMWMRYTKGRLNEIPGLNPYTRLAGAIAVPTLVRNIGMTAVGEKESLFTSTRNAIGSTVALSIGYKMMVRGESSNFRMFEGIQLPSKVTSLPGKFTPYLERTGIPKWTQNITGRFSNFGRPMDNFGPLESATFVERMNHSVGTFAQLIRNQAGEKGAKFWQPFEKLADAAGAGTKFTDLIAGVPVRMPMQLEASMFAKLKEAIPQINIGTIRTSVNEYIATIRANPVLAKQLESHLTELEKLVANAQSRGYQIAGVEVSKTGVRTVLPGKMAVEDAFMQSGVTYETLSTVMGRTAIDQINAGPLAQRFGAIQTPFGGLKLRTVGDLQTFTAKAYEDLSRIQSAIASVESKKALGMFDNLNIEQALKKAAVPEAEIARLKVTADFFGVSTRGQLKGLLNKFSNQADSASVLFPQVFKPGVQAGDDLVSAALANPRLFDGPMQSVLFAQIPKAELSYLQNAFYRQQAATNLQVFERANYLNSGQTIIAQSELRTLYQNAFSGLNKMLPQLPKITTAAADDSLEKVFGTVANSGITKEMIEQARSIGITNYGQLKAFVEKFGKEPGGFTLENTFSKLYPNMEANLAADISLSELLRKNPKALSGEGYSMITASVSNAERQLLGTSSVLSDTVSINNKLFADRLATADIRTIEQFRARIGESLKKQLEPFKKTADFSTLSAEQKSLLDSLGLKNASEVRTFLSGPQMADEALEKLFPRIANMRGAGGQVLSERLYNSTLLQDLATKTPDMFSGNGLRLLGDNVDLGLSFTLAGQRAQAMLNMPGSRLQNARNGVSNYARGWQDSIVDWTRFTKLDPTTATMAQISRSQIAHSYYSGLAVLGTYRTLVTAPNNMEAGDSLSQALINAHFPSDGGIFTNILSSTPGAALFMPLLVRGGYVPNQISALQRFKDYGLSGIIKSPMPVLANPVVDLTRQGLSRVASSTSLWGTPIAAAVAFGPTALPAMYDSMMAQNRFIETMPYLNPSEIRNIYVRTRDNGYQNLPINGEYISIDDYRQRNGIPKPEPQTVAPLERPAPVLNDIYKLDTTQVVPRAALDASEQQRLQAQGDPTLLNQDWAPHLESMRKLENDILIVQKASQLARLNEAAVTLEALSTGQPVQGGAQQLARVAEVLQSIASAPEVAQDPANQALIASMGQVYQALVSASTSGDLSSFAQAQDSLKTVSGTFKQYKLTDAQVSDMQATATNALNEARAIAAQYQQPGSAQANFILSELGKIDQNIKSLSQSIFGQAVSYPEITPQMVMAKADNPQINQLRAELAKFESLQNLRTASARLATQAAVTTTNNVTVASLNPAGLNLGPNASLQDTNALAAYQSFIAATNNRDLNASPEVVTQLAQTVTPEVQRVIGNDASANELLRLLQDATGKGDTDAAYASLKAAARVADTIDIGSLASKLANNPSPDAQAALQMQAQLAGIAKLKYAQMAYRRQDYTEAQAYLIKARAQYGDQLESMLQPNTYLDQGLDREGFLTGAMTQMKKDGKYDPALMNNTLSSFFGALEKGNFGAKAEDGTPGAQTILAQVKDAYNSKKQAVESALAPLNQQENLLKAKLQALGVPYENREAFLAGETNKTSEKYLQVESINRELKMIEASRNVRNQELSFDYNRMRLAEGLYDAAQGNYASANAILKEVKQNSPQLAANKELDLDGKISMTEPGTWGWVKRNWQAVTMFTAGLAATVAGAVAFSTIVGSVPGAGAMTIGVGLMGAALAGAGTAAIINGGVTLAVTRDANQALNATYAGAKEGAIAGLIAPIGILGKLKPLPAMVNPSVPSFVAGTYNFLRPAAYSIGAGGMFAANDTLDHWNEKSWSTRATEFGTRTLLYASMFQFFGNKANPLAEASVSRLPFNVNLANATRYAPRSYLTGIELTRATGDIFQKSVDVINDPYKAVTGSDLTNQRFIMGEGQSFILPFLSRTWNNNGLGLNPNNNRDLNWIKNNHLRVMRTVDSFYVLKQQQFNAQNFVPSISYGPFLKR
ncbi:MAG: hypothetical protein KIT34_06435 [Cyanobacteria bacterium TGS_CYA1]|nr:hypothetical protein [Cyanobacteria bacterium TGS_CYA1]